MATDLSLSSNDQVLALINSENTTQLTSLHITLGDPIELIEDVRNSQIRVTSTPNGGYNGFVDVKYNRLELDGYLVYGSPDIEIPVDGNFTDVVNYFNILYGANIAIGLDIEDVVLSGIDYVGKIVSMNAVETSKAYIGSLNLNVKWESTALSTVITDTFFSGLAMPLAEGAVLVGTTVNKLASELQAAHTATADANYMYVYGGSGVGQQIYTLQRYSFAANTWTELAGSAGISGPNSTDIAMVNGKIYKYNGTTMYIYDIAGNTWSEVNAPVLASGFGNSTNNRIVAHGGNLYLVGGSASALSGDAGTYHKRLFRYNIVPNTWTELAPIPYSNVLGIRDHWAAVIADKIYVGNGFVNTGPAATSYSTRLFIYDIPSNTWSEGASTSVGRRSGAAAVAGNRLYAHGGLINGSTATALMETYSVNDNTWAPVQNVGAARNSHVMVGTANHLYIHGGYNGATTSRLGDVIEVS